MSQWMGGHVVHNATHVIGCNNICSRMKSNHILMCCKNPARLVRLFYFGFIAVVWTAKVHQRCLYSAPGPTGEVYRASQTRSLIWGEGMRRRKGKGETKCMKSKEALRKGREGSRSRKQRPKYISGWYDLGITHAGTAIDIYDYDRAFADVRSLSSNWRSTRRGDGY